MGFLGQTCFGGKNEAFIILGYIDRGMEKNMDTTMLFMP